MPTVSNLPRPVLDQAELGRRARETSGPAWSWGGAFVADLIVGASVLMAAGPGIALAALVAASPLGFLLGRGLERKWNRFHAVRVSMLEELVRTLESQLSTMPQFIVQERSIRVGAPWERQYGLVVQNDGGAAESVRVQAIIEEDEGFDVEWGRYATGGETTVDLIWDDGEREHPIGGGGRATLYYARFEQPQDQGQAKSTFSYWARGGKQECVATWNPDEGDEPPMLVFLMRIVSRPAQRMPVDYRITVQGASATMQAVPLAVPAHERA